MFACSFKVVAQLIVSFYCEFLVAPVGLLPFPAGNRTNERRSALVELLELASTFTFVATLCSPVRAPDDVVLHLL